MSPNKQLSVYLIEHPINSYVEAIELIESHSPLELVKSFNLHIKGRAVDSDHIKPNQVILARSLGARPAIQVVTHGFYSTVQLAKAPLCSLIATLRLTDNPHDIMICILSECDIISVDTNVDDEKSSFKESIPIQGKHAYPWIRIKDILES